MLHENETLSEIISVKSIENGNMKLGGSHFDPISFLAQLTWQLTKVAFTSLNRSSIAPIVAGHSASSKRQHPSMAARLGERVAPTSAQ